mgnify:CR=1 FL=1
MYLVGGSVSLLSFLIFAFLVPPLDEPLDLSMQCKPLAARLILHAALFLDVLRGTRGAFRSTANTTLCARSWAMTPPAC